MQLLTWLPVSDYRNFWSTERSSLNINSFTWNNCFSYRNFRLPMSALATIYSKCTAKIDFPIGYFMLPYCWCWHWKSKVSPYIIWYLDHMLVKFEQNRMVQSIQNFELFDQKLFTILTKHWYHFGKRFCDWYNCFYAKLLIQRLYHLSVFQTSR